MRGIWERFACISRRRSTDSGRASREEKNHLGEYPETKGKRLSVFLPPLQLRFVQSSALAGNRGVFAMSSHPFRVRTRNTRINMKFHRRNTGALPLSLSRGAKEGRGRATPVVALHSRRREGKNPPVYQESSGRNGDREREKKGISTPRLAFRASHSRRARSIVGIYFDSRFVSFNSSPSASIFWFVPYWRSNIIRGIDRKLITTRRGLACVELFESQTRRMPFLISSPDHPNIAYANGIVSAESREAWRGDERANF